MRAASRLLMAIALAVPSMAAAQGRQPAQRPGPSRPANRAAVEVAPIRCWWRTSTGAVTIGAPFDVRLTCAVLETDTVQVVPDESRLTVAAVQLKPFEVLGGDHPGDTRAGQRRFFQYRYSVRLIDADSIGNDVSLPNLTFTYRVQSRVSEDSTLTGRDFTYVMPGLPVHVLSLVPEDGVDIRDGADVGLERIEALQFRGRLFEIGALALAGLGIVLVISAAIAAVARARGSEVRGQPRASDRRVLGAAADALSRVSSEAAGGWSPELVSAAHAALRVIAASAIGRPVSEQALAPGAAPADGRLAVRSLIPGRAGVAVTSATTTADVARAIATLPADVPLQKRSGLESLQSALTVFTTTRYVSGEARPDAGALGVAVEAGRAEAARLARERLWNWRARPSAERAWREGAAQS